MVAGPKVLWEQEGADSSGQHNTVASYWGLTEINLVHGCCTHWWIPGKEAEQEAGKAYKQGRATLFKPESNLLLSNPMKHIIIIGTKFCGMCCRLAQTWSHALTCSHAHSFLGPPQEVEGCMMMQRSRIGPRRWCHKCENCLSQTYVTDIFPKISFYVRHDMPS